jgi:O-antigen/teichoic acid export membrane protein
MRLPLLSPPRMRQLWYVPLLALSMGLMMLRILVMARLLDVHAFAEFSGGILISSTFCMIGCLGLQSILQREWPVNLVRRQELRGLVRAAQCNLVALGCCLIGLMGAVFRILPSGTTSALLGIGLLHGVSQQLFLIATVESRSRGDVLRFSLQNLLRAVAAFALSVAAALWTGSAELALAIDALVTIALSLGFFQSALTRVRLGSIKVYLLAIRRLRLVRWNSALTMMLIMVIGFGLLNADRWVASNRLDLEGFAHYSFAWIVLSIAQSAQAVVNASVYPLLARRFAEYGRRAAFRVCLRVSTATLIVGAVTAFPLYFILDYGIDRWYPHYGDARAVVPLFLAIAVLRVSDFWTSFLLIAGHEAQLLKLNLCAMAFGLLGWLCLMRLWNLESMPLHQVSWLAALLTLGAYVAAAEASRRAGRG